MTCPICTYHYGWEAQGQCLHPDRHTKEARDAFQSNARQVLVQGYDPYDDRVAEQVLGVERVRDQGEWTQQTDGRRIWRIRTIPSGENPVQGAPMDFPEDPRVAT